MFKKSGEDGQRPRSNDTQLLTIAVALENEFALFRMLPSRTAQRMVERQTLKLVANCEKVHLASEDWTRH